MKLPKTRKGRLAAKAEEMITRPSVAWEIKLRRQCSHPKHMRNGIAGTECPQCSTAMAIVDQVVAELSDAGRTGE